MDNLLENIGKYLYQITTPYSIGAGLLLPGHGLIVTSEYVVRDNGKVVVEDEKGGRQLAQVVYIDQLYDLAFIRLELPSEKGSLPPLPVLKEVVPGIAILALGRQKGALYSAAGDIIGIEREQSSYKLIQHSAAVEEECLGGPLLSPSGAIAGMNCFLVPGEKQHYSLPFSCVEEVLESFLESKAEEGTRCLYCLEEVFSDPPSPSDCPFCLKHILFPSQVQPYLPEGVAATIEGLLKQLGHDLGLGRRGPNCWIVPEGSALIQLTYHPESGMISGEATLGLLSENVNGEIFRFLLRQNYEMEGLSFYVKDGEIVLTLIIYDRYLNLETGMKLLRHLLQKADYYDNILVEEYGAKWANS
jgi:serine protease Do